MATIDLSRAVATWILGFQLLATVFARAQEDNDWFEAKVRPLLVDHCYECHSGTKSKGGLLLDSKQGWSKGSDSGPVVVPGDPESSSLIQAVRYQGLQMPPSGKLEDRDIQVLVEWVTRGAHDPRDAIPKVGGMDTITAQSWWAFQPLPAPIDSFGPAWIDRQIAAQLESHGITPSETADARTLVRRLSYDLTGLPPNLGEIERVVQVAEGESKKAALNELIESKLNSPDYGVHWGRHWLDVVRYADTAGENTDRPVVNAWRYRNWVFDAFSRDMPYDSMIRYQIAGDTQEQRSDGIIATGFLAIARRFGHDIDKDMHLTLEEMIDTTGKAFLGLTLGCARCHDHKYDPVSAEDYYALYGILSSTKYSFPGCEPKGQPKDMVPLLEAAQVEALMQPWQAKADAAKLAKEAQQKQIQEARASLAQIDPTQRVLIAQSNVAEGAKVDFDSKSSDKTITVRVGELIQLTVYPNGNHGADSTAIGLNIRQTEGSQAGWSTDQLIEGFSSANTRKIGPWKAQSQQGLRADWFYLETTKGPELLTDRKLSNGGNSNVHSWSIGELPSVFANVSDAPAAVWTNLPGKTLFVHPGPERPVSVVWVSPIDGAIDIDGFVQDAHPAALDGVSFKLEHIGVPGAGESLSKMAQILQTPIEEPGPAPPIPVAYAAIEGTPADAKLHLRGDPEKLGPNVPRRWLSILGGDLLKDQAASGRRELADWIASHPLAARVIVNRVWQWHFGYGLVRTPSDFGSRGELPTHPELLDQLSAQFVKSGYSIKQLHRWILATEAYQRASVSTQHQRDSDPENRLLSHFPRRRLRAEEIRDSILMCSGNLDRSVGQEHPFPPTANWTFTQHDPFNAVYPTNRRSAMLMVQRQRRHPFLALFDGADPNASTATRQTTLVPTQALYYLNDPFFHEQALTIANECIGLGQPAEIVQAIYVRTLMRQPSNEETQSILEWISGYQGSAQQSQPSAETWSAAVRMLMASNEFHFID
ncbi:MAG: PSD1 and planctomycete cytochrome C domain-containing protein [Pirellula sp.]